MPKIRQSSLRNIHQYRHFPTFCSCFVRHLGKMLPTRTIAGSARFCYTWVIRLHFSLTTTAHQITIYSNTHSFIANRVPVPPHTEFWFSKMATAQKNTCVSGSAGRELPSPATARQEASPDADLPSPENLLQEYSELQARFRRTTNALASAAHDLKTPLAILNGYVEVLQSEKLGGLNPRQHEVLRDMRSSGQRLQHFIQDFLTYSVLETGELKLHYE